MRANDCLAAIDCVPYPDEPELSGPIGGMFGDLTWEEAKQILAVNSREMTAALQAQVQAYATVYASPGMQELERKTHIWHLHTGKSPQLTPEVQVPEEWEVFPNRLRNHGPPQPNRTHARHNKHLGKGKRKK